MARRARALVVVAVFACVGLAQSPAAAHDHGAAHSHPVRSHAAHDEHAGHDHAAHSHAGHSHAGHSHADHSSHAGHAAHDEHAGHGHDEHAHEHEHDDHEDGHCHHHEHEEHEEHEHEYVEVPGSFRVEAIPPTPRADAAAAAAAGAPAWDSALDATYPATAIALTVFSGMSASLGGLAVVLLGAPSPRVLGHLLSFAAGIMLYVSYADLLPHAIADMDAAAAAAAGGGAHAHDHGAHGHGAHGHGHVHGPGLFEANAFMFVGMAAFAGIAALVPLIDAAAGGGGGPEGAADGPLAHSHGVPADGARAGAGAVGLEPAHEAAAAAAAAPAAPAGARARSRSRSPAGAGTRARARARVAAAPRRAASEPAAAAPPSSSGAPAASPPPAAARGESGLLSKRRLWVTGMVAAVGIAAHNLPEGLIVYNQTITGLCTAPARAPGQPSTLPPWLVPAGDALGLPADPASCATRGLAVTLAIALHNVPEGMAVASPIYASTGSAWEAMKWTLLSSAAEPAAAVVFGLLYSSRLTPHLVSALNAGVAGVMIALCLVELAPAAAEAAGARAAAATNIAGQLAMFASLHAMRAAGVH